MSEPDPSFSNGSGPAQGATPTSTDPVTGQTVPANPGFLLGRPSAPGTHTDNHSYDGDPPGGRDYDPLLGPNTQPK